MFKYTRKVPSTVYFQPSTASFTCRDIGDLPANNNFDAVRSAIIILENHSDVDFVFVIMPSGETYDYLCYGRANGSCGTFPVLLADTVTSPLIPFVEASLKAAGCGYPATVEPVKSEPITNPDGTCKLCGCDPEDY